LEIYKFLSIKETLLKAASLSKTERELVFNSQISREEKGLNMTFGSASFKPCLVCSQDPELNLDLYFKKRELAISLTDYLNMSVVL
jgi:hypothetical protein